MLCAMCYLVAAKRCAPQCCTDVGPENEYMILDTQCGFTVLAHRHSHLKQAAVLMGTCS
jgi:hypothetical protein